jgi:hypothetical protein
VYGAIYSTNVTPSATNYTLVTNGSFLQINGSNNVNLMVANSSIANATSTGLAVTGTLSATGAVTLSGGTANGVTYLDGSKVLTTNSTLTFNGTQLAIDGSASTVSYKIKYNGSEVGFLQNYQNTELDFGTAVNAPILFYVNNTELMRLTSTGLGIGTSSPASGGGGGLTLGTTSSGKSFHVYSSSYANNGLGNFYGTDGNMKLQMGALSATSAYVFANTGCSLVLFSGGNTSATLDSSGNLGLGVTPSAAFSSGKSLEIWYAGNAFWSNGANDVRMSANVKYNLYAANGAASTYVQSSGAHYWSIAGSGTAGNAITFTTAMTLDASGNLLVGNTTGSGKLYVEASSTPHIVARNPAGTSYSSIRLYNDTNSNSRALEIDYSGSTYPSSLVSGGPTGESALITTTGSYPLVFGTANTARATIDSSGNVGIGTSSPSSALYVKRTSSNVGMYVDYNGTNVGRFEAATNGNLYIGLTTGSGGISIGNTADANAVFLDSSGNLGVGTTSPTNKITSVIAGNNSAATDYILSGGSATYQMLGIGEYTAGNAIVIANKYSGGGHITFRTGSATPAEVARIDGSGNLLVGTTSAGGYKFVVTTTGGNYVANFNTGNNGVGLTIANSASGSQTFQYFYSAGTNVGSITTNGTITVYNTTSDYRLKTVIGAVSESGKRIDALEPVEYTWNSNGSRTRGFLAHQFQEVYPDSVSGTKDAVDDDGKPVYQAMQAGTSEVIADLVAEIQSLRARVAQLETKGV